MPDRTDHREAIVQALRQFSVEGAARPLPRVGGAARPSSSEPKGQAAPATPTKVEGAASPSSSHNQEQAAPDTFPAAARAFFAALGYQSDRRLPITTARQFREQLDPGGKLTDRERETLDQLTSLHLLFQLTGAELDTHGDLLDDRTAVQPTRIESYLFFAAELPPGHYTRTALSTLVRAINKPLPMPALVLFRHGDTVSLGIIHRRLHRRDQSRDVLEKVTLIKDIACDDPIRAHIEILNDFALANLDADFGVPDFVRLHEAWQKRLGSYVLSNDFYREIADWYFWAHHQVEDGAIRLPQHCDTEQEKSLFLIRLLTRVIFCWFLVEKRLIPTDLFRDHRLKALLKDFNPSRDPKQPDTAPTYYHAILQNLFFGTLNMPPEQRGFRKRNPSGGRDPNFGITNLWRYESDFRDPEAWKALAARIPFLNGGLFDCLDDKVGGAARPSKSVEGAASPLASVGGAARPSSSDQQGQAAPATPSNVGGAARPSSSDQQEQAAPDTFTRKILDGFSDNPKLACHLPNDLFFGPERTVDLSRDYGEEDKKTARSKRAKVRGLIEILFRYKFTIEENTPLEEEIALDPELLGKVFENLLASYNEDTRTTARKALGAFYTPREIVNYMVDEALKSYLTTQVPGCKGALDDLFSNKATLKEIKPDTRDALIAAIGRVKILDPACGSGAFPMGALHRLVDLLQKLDPNNESWKRDRLAEARRYRQLLEESGAPREELAACDARIADIEKSFDSRYHALDFARKLYLIENSIYGVDIQPIATQIAKLRFFISLVVDQKVAQTILSGSQGSPGNLAWVSDEAAQTRAQTGSSVLPFDREAPVHKTHRNLPHWTQKDRTYWVTFRLADSLPAAKLKAWQEEQAIWLSHNPPPWNDRQWQEYDERFGQRLEEWLDAGEGECHLRRPDVRAIVERCLRHFDGRRYDLAAWVIMPNHVHLLIRPRENHSLSKILQGIKGVSARECNALLGRTGQTFWQEESFDHIVRSSAQFARFIRYIAENPVKARLRDGEYSIAQTILSENPPRTSTGAPGLTSQTGLSGLPWNLGIRPLPNLETKFVAADTLIPIEKAESDLFSGEIDRLRAELAAIRHEHFNARSPAAKRKWREADAAKRAELAAELEKSHALSKETARKLAAWDPYDQNASAPFFDPEWMFGLKVGPPQSGADIPVCGPQGGADIPVCDSPTRQTRMSAPPSAGPFDIVIGNPPYVRQEQLKHLKEHFRKHYDCFTGTADLYVYFYEAGIRLLRPGGTFSFITSNKWFRAAYGEKLRAWLARHTRVLQLIDFGDAPVFTAIAYPCIVIVQRTDAPVDDDANVRALTWEPGPAIETFAEVFQRKSFALPQRELKPDGWRLESGATLRLLERLRQVGKPLGEYVNGRFYRGILTGLNEAFVVDRATRDRLIAEHPSSAEVLKPFLRGRDIKRWRVEPQDLWLIFTRRGINIKNYPAIYEHLLPFKKRLMPGAPGGRKPGSYQWYEIQDNIAYWQEFERPKIIYPNICSKNEFAWDDSAYYTNQKAFIITGGSKMLLGVLNSAVMMWLFQQLIPKLQNGFFEPGAKFLNEFPIPFATEIQREPIERIADYLLFLHRHLADHPETASTRDPLMVAYWEQVLNGLVYELYFPEELHAAGLRLFDLVGQAFLPALPPKDADRNVCATFLKTLRTKFEELYDARHPLKVALQKLQTLDTVRIIEGKA